MAGVSMADYLKRYASKDSDDAAKEKKKKKKKSKEKHAAKVLPRMRIIDNDVYVPTADEERAAAGDGATLAVEDDLKDQGVGIDELPQVAGSEDDRPAEVIILECFKKSGRWKDFQTIKDEPEDDSDDKQITTSDAVKREPEGSPVRIKREPTSDDEDHHNKGRKRHDSDDSPPRRRHDSDDSLPRRRHDSDDSPPRKRHDSDDSPPRRRHDSDDSPPRKRHDSDDSPPRRRRDSDASPPRKKNNSSSRAKIKEEVDSDASPPRKVKREDSDESPPRKNKREDSDESPPRKIKREDSDESPPRNKFQQMKKTLDGKRAGLQSAKGLKDEMLSFREREKNAILSLDNSKSGRGAETVVRGRLKDKEKEKKEKEEQQEKVKKMMEEKYSRWNKGVKQVSDAGKKLDDDLYEMSKSLTRTVDDTDRDAMLKDVMREDDPMAKYITKTKEKQKTGKRRPVYQGPQPPPNRYGIPPGYRWDGVDRSNGFETKLMTRNSTRKAHDEEAYKWSVEDM